MRATESARSENARNLSRLFSESEYTIVRVRKMRALFRPDHCRSAQPMSLLGQSRPSNSAPTWPFVGCCSNKRQTQTQSVCPKSANNKLVRAGYNYVETSYLDMQ